MTNSQKVGQYFEQEFELCEKNRMYPPNHTGETMITINDTHLMALGRARHFVQSGICNSMSPKLVSAVERDLRLIDEIHTYVRQQIVEPGLPMLPEFVGPKDNSEKDGRTDTKTSD